MFGWLADIINNIKGVFEGIKNVFTYLIKGFWEDLAKFFKMLFVPEEDYFTKKFEDIKLKISSKLNIDVSQMEQLNLGSSAPGDVGTNVNGVYVDFINFGFVRDNIGVIRGMLGTILYLFLFYFHYRMAVKLIRGVDVGSGGGK